MSHAIIGWHGFDLFSPSTWLPNFGLWGGGGYSGGINTDVITPDMVEGGAMSITVNGVKRESPVDLLFMAHDLAYQLAEDMPNESALIYVWGSGGGFSFINWTASQIKVNYNNKSYLIGTDGNDVFDADYFSTTPSYIINSELLTHFLAGNGDDMVGGSARADNIWGGLGKDILFGYAGDDTIYGEEGDDELQGGSGMRISANDDMAKMAA